MAKKRRSALKPHQQEILEALLAKRTAVQRQLSEVDQTVALLIAFGSPFADGEFDTATMSYIRPEDE